MFAEFTVIKKNWLKAVAIMLFLVNMYSESFCFITPSSYVTFQNEHSLLEIVQFFVFKELNETEGNVLAVGSISF
jgi:hypothetical protein